MIATRFSVGVKMAEVRGKRSAPIYRGLDPLTLPCDPVDLLTLTLDCVDTLKALCLLGLLKVNRIS